MWNKDKQNQQGILENVRKEIGLILRDQGKVL
jgi:hypothetical protein